MRAILAELDAPDPEHPDTWLSDESGWTIAVSEQGVVVWENLEAGDKPRYQDEVSREESLRLWLLLALGDYDEIERQPWKDGQGPPIPKAEIDRRRKDSEEIVLGMQRKFYDGLGPEDNSSRCKHDGCNRGTVRFSTFCRLHHFENVRREPCPFHH